MRSCGIQETRSDFLRRPSSICTIPCWPFSSVPPPSSYLQHHFTFPGKEKISHLSEAETSLRRHKSLVFPQGKKVEKVIFLGKVEKVAPTTPFIFRFFSLLFSRPLPLPLSSSSSSSSSSEGFFFAPSPLSTSRKYPSIPLLFPTQKSKHFRNRKKKKNISHGKLSEVIKSICPGICSVHPSHICGFCGLVRKGKGIKQFCFVGKGEKMSLRDRNETISQKFTVVKKKKRISLFSRLFYGPRHPPPPGEKELNLAPAAAGSVVQKMFKFTCLAFPLL